MKINSIHHIAIICSDYERSKMFYTEILGFAILSEHYRADRNSYKLDLAVGGRYQIELFSFPDAPERPGYPEAKGLRHLAFAVGSVEEAVAKLPYKGIETEEICKVGSLLIPPRHNDIQSCPRKVSTEMGYRRECYI